MFSPLFDDLVRSLSTLPGIGPKTAQRLALHLLEKDPVGATQLVNALEVALQKVSRCQNCRNLTEETLCRVCSDEKRDPELLCVVEAPGDLLALEQAGVYQGRYFVLYGCLSPIDGIGPEQLGLEELERYVLQKGVKEVVIATNPTVEGEATSFYIAEMLKPHDVRASRIAHGVPLGGDLGYVDSGTLAHALVGRKPVEA